MIGGSDRKTDPNQSRFSTHCCQLLLENQTTTLLPSLNNGRWGAAACLIGDRIFVGGGAGSGTGADDPASVEMLTLPHGKSWITRHRMQGQRFYHQMVYDEFNYRLLSIGGHHDDSIETLSNPPNLDSNNNRWTSLVVDVGHDTDSIL